jgi:hypothetical protein
MDGLRELLEGSPLTKGDRSTLVDLADRLLQIVSQASAYASGHEVEKPNAKEASPFDFDATVRDTLGWQLVVLEDPFATVAPLLRNAVRFYAQPSLKKAFDLDGASKRKDGPRTPTFVLAPMPRSVPFGKDVLHAVFTVFLPDFSQLDPTPRKGAKRKEKALSVHFMLAADGPRTIFALGFDDVALAHRVKSSLSASPMSGTLAEREGLEFLRDPRVGYGGFSSMARFAKAAKRFGDDSEETKKTIALFAKHPLRFVGRAEQTSGPTSGRVTSAIQVDRELIVEALRWSNRASSPE